MRFAALVAGLLLLLALAACAIPVRNENNDKPLLVAPVGTSVPKPDGTVVHNASLPQPKAGDYRHEEGMSPWLLAQLAAGLLFGGTGIAAIQRIRTLATAVRDAAAYGDDMERAETAEDVHRVKAKHAARQGTNGTHKHIARIRRA